MRIQFLPQYEMANVTHVLTNTEWSYGEIKDIPDDATFRQNIDGQSVYVRWTDDLLSSPSFRMADSDSNPNYQCSDCGSPALEEGHSDAFGIPHLYQSPEGDKLCSSCFAAAASTKDESKED